MKWWGRSRWLHNWAAAKAKVYIDFGGDHLWRLITFDPKTKLGAVGAIARVDLIHDGCNCVTISATCMDE